jgi:hypothetical protein
LIEAHACADLVNRGDSGRFLAYSGEIEGGPGERLNDLELAGKGPYAVRPFPGVSNDAILSLDILRLHPKALEPQQTDNVPLPNRGANARDVDRGQGPENRRRGGHGKIGHERSVRAEGRVSSRCARRRTPWQRWFALPWKAANAQKAPGPSPGKSSGVKAKLPASFRTVGGSVAALQLVPTSGAACRQATPRAPYMRAQSIAQLVLLC